MTITHQNFSCIELQLAGAFGLTIAIVLSNFEYVVLCFTVFTFGRVISGREAQRAGQYDAENGQISHV